VDPVQKSDISALDIICNASYFLFSPGSTNRKLFQGGSCVPEVYIDEGESFEKALKKFKKKCEKAGILSDLRKHRHFEKPSEKRKRKMNAAKRKLKKEARHR